MRRGWRNDERNTTDHRSAGSPSPMRRGPRGRGVESSTRNHEAIEFDLQVVLQPAQNEGQNEQDAREHGDARETGDRPEDHPLPVDERSMNLEELIPMGAVIHEDAISNNNPAAEELMDLENALLEALLNGDVRVEDADEDNYGGDGTEQHRDDHDDQVVPEIEAAAPSPLEVGRLFGAQIFQEPFGPFNHAIAGQQLPDWRERAEVREELRQEGGNDDLPEYNEDEWEE